MSAWSRFAADSIGGLPEHHQCLGDRVAVATWARPSHRRELSPAQPQNTDRMLRWYPVTATNSSKIRHFPSREPER